MIYFILCLFRLCLVSYSASCLLSGILFPATHYYPYSCPHFHTTKRIYITSPAHRHTFELFMSTSINPKTHTIKLRQLYNLWPTVGGFSPVNPIFRRKASFAAPHVTLPCMNKDTESHKRQDTSYSLPDELFVWCPPAAKCVCFSDCEGHNHTHTN